MSRAHPFPGTLPGGRLRLGETVVAPPSHTSVRSMAFLDEEQDVAAPQPPERPRREASGPARKRRQFLLRRLIAVVVGLVLLVAFVLLFRGCLEARSDRGLRNYSQSVGTIMQESQQRGAEFFEALEDDTLTEQALEDKISGIRSASASLLDRAENVDAPGEMRDAQSATTLSLRLRRDALEQITANIGRATADAETQNPTEVIAAQMGSLYASDILWAQLASPEIQTVLSDDDVEAAELPAGNFMPENDPTRYLEQSEIVSLIGGIGGDEDGGGGLRGLELSQVSLGDTALAPDTTTSVPDDSREVSVQVLNGGEQEETGVEVIVTVDGEEFTGTIAKLPAGDTGEAKIALTTLPQPGTEIQVDVLVQPVPGEELTDNNEASYTVIFGPA